MYVSMKDILTHADKHNYAVMAVNSVNMEMARAVITAAEEEHSPIIINIGVDQRNGRKSNSSSSFKFGSWTKI